MLDMVKVFVQNILARLSNILSICVVGSRITTKGLEEVSDLDIIILVDDSTSIDKIETTQIIKQIGKKVNPIIHCQVYYLTDFWKYIETGSPITYTIIRDAVIYYDIGFFETLQKLVRMGSIKPKTEAVERQFAIAKQLMKITYHSVNLGLIQNLQGAIVSSTQSLLMELGIQPPSPKEVANYVKTYLVDRNYLEDKYYEIARKVIQTYKDAEHNKANPLSGKELQELYNDTSKFVMKIEEVLSKIRQNV